MGGLWSAEPKLPPRPGRRQGVAAAKFAISRFEKAQTNHLIIAAVPLSAPGLEYLSNNLEWIECDALTLNCVNCSQVDSLVAEVGRLPQMKVLHLINFATLRAPQLAKSVAMSCTLHTLSLTKCNLQPDFLDTLCSELQRSLSIKCLNVAYNPQLGDWGAAALAALLQKNVPLQVLHAGGIGMSNKGLEDIVDSLKHNDYLQRLFLPDHTWQGAEEVSNLLCRIVKPPCRLSTLNLGGLRREVYTEDVLAAFEGNFSLTSYPARGPFPDQVGAQLAQIMERNEKLYFDLASRFAFVSGLHPRLGAASSVGVAFAQDILFDHHVINLILAF